MHEVYPGSGNNNLRNAGAHIMMSQHNTTAGLWDVSPRPIPSDTANRLERLEQELHHLRMLRSQGPDSQRPTNSIAAMHDQQSQQMVPFAAHHAMMQATAAAQPMCVPVPYPLSQTAPMGVAQNQDASHEHKELLSVHRELLQTMQDQQDRHNQLLSTHTELMKAHMQLMERAVGGGPGGSSAVVKKQKAKHPSLGVIRLDYNYPAAKGDTDSPASFGYDVIYRVVPQFTFAMAQSGKFTETVEREFAEGIKFLEARGVDGITGDCGFMMAFQVLARRIASKPVFMSSMVQCPVIACAFEPRDQILILTANGESLKPQKEVLLSSCGFDVDENRFLIRGCQNVPGFDAVEKGEQVPVEIVQPGIIKLTMDALEKHPAIKGILLECTELPAYADALRAATGLPVWDCITCCDFFISARQQSKFGLQDWQDEWDGVQEGYNFGDNLTEGDKKMLDQKIVEEKVAKAKAKANPKAKAAAAKAKRKIVKSQAPVLGVIRLDYNYPPAKGDIDCPGSFDYEVLFRVVPGLTFEMAQAGRMTYQVQQNFVKAIQWLENRNVAGITGDCGFMMAFQPLAREVATVPVFMSSMVQCPLISVCIDKYEKIMILTANSETLKPQKDTLLNQCGFDVDDTRFIIYGCQTVPGFDAVSKGEKVDVDKVTPGIVKLAKEILEKQPTIRAICLECTELPPYSNALRKETGLPVFDSITCADFFISARKDNPRFGLNQWQNDWDGQIAEYQYAQNLTEQERNKLINKS